MSRPVAEPLRRRFGRAKRYGNANAVRANRATPVRGVRKRFLNPASEKAEIVLSQPDADRAPWQV